MRRGENQNRHNEKKQSPRGVREKRSKILALRIASKGYMQDVRG